MSAANDEWYYAQNGQRIGPVSLAAVQTLLSRGSLSAQDYVWTDGMANWSPAGTVPELSAATIGVATASPPPPYGAPRQQPQQAYGCPSPYPPQGTGTVSYYTPQSLSGFPGALPYAGFWLRFVAWFLDTLILTGIGMAVGFVVGFVLGMALAAGRGNLSPSDTSLISVVGNLVGAVINFVYFTMMERGSKQSTWGKRALGLRVTNDSGGRITYGQAAGRYLGKILSMLILCFGYFMAGWTQRKQALHDMMAGTLVVRAQ